MSRAPTGCSPTQRKGRRKPLKSRIRSQLAVTEGKWDSETNTSIRGLFDVLTDIWFGNPHAYSYEMFCDAHVLDNIVSRLADEQLVRYLHIGAHGDETGIASPGGIITRTRLKNILNHLCRGTIEGLYIGTCFFGHEENAAFLLNPPGGELTPIKWVAGYTKDVGWVDSAALELLFWNEFFAATGSPVARITRTANRVQRLAAGLVQELGFCIYIRKPGPGGGVRELLATERRRHSTQDLL